MYSQYFSEGLDSVKFSGQIAGFKSPGWEPSAATQVFANKEFTWLNMKLKRIQIFILCPGQARGRGAAPVRGTWRSSQRELEPNEGPLTTSLLRGELVLEHLKDNHHLVEHLGDHHLVEHQLHALVNQQTIYPPTSRHVTCGTKVLHGIEVLQVAWDTSKYLNQLPLCRLFDFSYHPLTSLTTRSTRSTPTAGSRKSLDSSNRHAAIFLEKFWKPPYSSSAPYLSVFPTEHLFWSSYFPMHFCHTASQVF